jgi:hypothetical protein
MYPISRTTFIGHPAAFFPEIVYERVFQHPLALSQVIGYPRSVKITPDRLISSFNLWRPVPFTFASLSSFLNVVRPRPVFHQRKSISRKVSYAPAVRLPLCFLPAALLMA